jgi:metal-responsive CopG/Arc/MetJ family transcriptional regulator
VRLPVDVISQLDAEKKTGGYATRAELIRKIMREYYEFKELKVNVELLYGVKPKRYLVMKARKIARLKERLQ